MNYRMMLDVEAVGLFGEVFAFGYVVWDRAGKEMDSGIYSFGSEKAIGLLQDRRWVEDNVPYIKITHKTAREIRDVFWAVWLHWSRLGTSLWADCAWPLEARFLVQCVKDDQVERMNQGPYPLFDLSSILLAKGLNPIETYRRLPNELPAHNPLNDARQSMRVLYEVLPFVQ